MNIVSRVFVSDQAINIVSRVFLRDQAINIVSQVFVSDQAMNIVSQVFLSDQAESLSRTAEDLGKMQCYAFIVDTLVKSLYSPILVIEIM